MTSHVGRLYALALALFVFFLTWATVAGAPGRRAPRRGPTHGLRRSPHAQVRVRHESIVVARVVRRRWAVYRGSCAGAGSGSRQSNRANADAAAQQAAARATAAPLRPLRVRRRRPLAVTRRPRTS